MDHALPSAMQEPCLWQIPKPPLLTCTAATGQPCLLNCEDKYITMEERLKTQTLLAGSPVLAQQEWQLHDLEAMPLRFLHEGAGQPAPWTLEGAAFMHCPVKEGGGSQKRKSNICGLPDCFAKELSALCPPPPPCPQRQHGTNAESAAQAMPKDSAMHAMRKEVVPVFSAKEMSALCPPPAPPLKKRCSQADSAAQAMPKAPDVHAMPKEVGAFGPVGNRPCQESSGAMFFLASARLAGHVVDHCCQHVEKILRTRTTRFKIGMSMDPGHRWGNAKYGYCKTGIYARMHVMAETVTAEGAAFLEATLIQRFRDWPGNDNMAMGGEGMHTPSSGPGFVYIVYKAL